MTGPSLNLPRSPSAPHLTPSTPDGTRPLWPTIWPWFACLTPLLSPVSYELLFSSTFISTIQNSTILQNHSRNPTTLHCTDHRVRPRRRYPHRQWMVNFNNSSFKLDLFTVATLYYYQFRGKTADGPLQGVSPILNKVSAPGMTTAACSAVYGSIITDNILCIDTAGGKGSCNVSWLLIKSFPNYYTNPSSTQGDSGGPLHFNNGGSWNQVGIVSFGASAGCAAGYPAGFTRISSYTQWIVDNAGLIM